MYHPGILLEIGKGLEELLAKCAVNSVSGIGAQTDAVCDVKKLCNCTKPP